MVKPALPYLDVIHSLCQRFDVPISAYQVSGEYSMIMGAAQRGWLDEEKPDAVAFLLDESQPGIA